MFYPWKMYGEYADGSDYTVSGDDEADCMQKLIDQIEKRGILRDEIITYYENFDVSEEAYYWLDDSGHGKNGAPYDMKDVYEDMEECKEFIYDAFCLIRNLVFEQQNKRLQEIEENDNCTGD